MSLKIRTYTEHSNVYSRGQYAHTLNVIILTITQFTEGPLTKGFGIADM